MLFDLDKIHRNVLELNVQLTVFEDDEGDFVAIKLNCGVTIYFGMGIDGKNFAQREINGEFEEVYFPEKTSLAEMIRAANEWAFDYPAKAAKLKDISF